MANVKKAPSALGLFELWKKNHKKILTLAVINVCITASMEYICRTTYGTLHHDSSSLFFQVSSSGTISVHLQSLINIVMTFFASVFGGVVFFIHTRTSRYIFFVLFGVFNSMVSQTVIFLLMKDNFVDVARLSFDFIYNGSIKYVIFEHGRSFIVELVKTFSLGKVGFIRVLQDLFTTYIKVNFLEFLGFKG